MTDEVEILFALIRARYGARLDETQREDVKKVVEAIVRDVTTLRAFVLPDDIEPGQPFVPYRAES